MPVHEPAVNAVCVMYYEYNNLLLNSIFFGSLDVLIIVTFPLRSVLLLKFDALILLRSSLAVPRLPSKRVISLSPINLNSWSFKKG